jgi:hypothetical protein
VSKPLFEVLHESGLLSDGEVCRSAIESLSPKQIFELTAVLTQTFGSEPASYVGEAFTHSASLSLSGDSNECNSLPCRISRIDQLIRFALLYSDRVYMQNPFVQYSYWEPYFKRAHEADLKDKVYDDLCVVKQLEPLSDTDYVVLVTPKYRFHPACLAESVLGTGAGRRLRKARQQLAAQYLSKSRATLELDKDAGNYVLNLEGPQILYDHLGYLRNFEELPKALSRNTHLLRALESGECKALPTPLLKTLRAHESLADNVVDNVCSHLLMTLDVKSYFLSDRSVHASFLGMLSRDIEMDRRNLLAFRHLTSEVPFVGDVDIKDILKVREREHDALIQYRGALNQAIETFRSDTAVSSHKQARLLYQDVIAPRLASLDRKIKDSKRDLVKQAYRPFVGWVAAISFGLYSGLISTQVAGLASAIGLIQTGTRFVQDVMSLGDVDKQARADDLYFLWKVKQLASKRARRLL